MSYECKCINGELNATEQSFELLTFHRQASALRRLALFDLALSRCSQNAAESLYGQGRHR